MSIREIPPLILVKDTLAFVKSNDVLIRSRAEIIATGMSQFFQVNR